MSKRRSTAALLAFTAALQLITAAGHNEARAEKIMLSVLPTSTSGQTTLSKSSSTTQTAFDKLVDEYFNAAFASNPNMATNLGIHDFDNKMPTYSAESVKQRITELKRFKQSFSELDDSKLSHTSVIDKQMLIANANSELLELESIKNWTRNPDMYSSNCTAGIFDLIKRTFSTPEQRMRAVIAREKVIPVILKNARTNLSNTPKIYTEIALEQLPSSIDFFKDAVPKAFAEVKDPGLQAELKSTNDEAVAALKDYQTFLKSELLPKSVENFAIGKDNYEKKLAYDEMVDESLDSLLIKGNAELKRLQNEFKRVAHEIDSTKDPHEVYASISSEHPKPDHLIAAVTGVLANLKEQSRKIVTIPSEDELQVQETPPFLRAVTFASMDSPGPFETKAKEAYYQVTLPEKDWSPEKTEQHMRFFCDRDLINTSVHEAYPGHYVQGLWMRLAPSKARKMLWCGTNSEGWAHYCEEMMIDEQLVGAGDKKLKLVQFHDALLRASRYIVGISMHTKGMTMEQGKEFFIKEGYQEPANAERETKRGTSDPTYLVYTLGKLQILALRDDYKKAKGDKYSLKEFHDQFLAQGCAPIKLVRQTLLKTN